MVNCAFVQVKVVALVGLTMRLVVAGIGIIDARSKLSLRLCLTVVSTVWAVSIVIGGRRSIGVMACV